MKSEGITHRQEQVFSATIFGALGIEATGYKLTISDSVYEGNFHIKALSGYGPDIRTPVQTTFWTNVEKAEIAWLGIEVREEGPPDTKVNFYCKVDAFCKSFSAPIHGILTIGGEQRVIKGKLSILGKLVVYMKDNQVTLAGQANSVEINGDQLIEPDWEKLPSGLKQFLGWYITVGGLAVAAWLFSLLGIRIKSLIRKP